MFAESLAVGQISPGPNGLWVVCLGYFLGGWTSALAALIAIAIPPLLILFVEKLYDRHRQHPAVEGFMAGLEVAVIAVFGIVMVQFLQEAPRLWLTPVAAVVAFGATLTGRVPIVAILGLAAVAGMLAR